jgi:hypothetical protein
MVVVFGLQKKFAKFFFANFLLFYDTMWQQSNGRMQIIREYIIIFFKVEASE